MHARTRFRLAATLAALFMTPLAGAATNPLGTVSEPVQFEVGGGGLDPFVDDYGFTVADGARLSFSALLGTPPSNRFWIPDIDAELWSDGRLLAEADARDRPGAPFPAQDVSLAAVVLGPGSYSFRVFGTPVAAYPGIGSSYNGTLRFSAVAAPVPEPASAALWLTALAGMGVLGRARATRRQAREHGKSAGSNAAPGDPR
jgi:hypothetical protein